ncbi:MAG: PEP/pyruvate-binding domain-containing protein [Hyphomicrobium sp.]
MMKDVITGLESTDRTCIGGKASTLVVLARHGLPIPLWFVVSPAAFYGSLSSDARAQLDRALTVDDFHVLLHGLDPSRAFRDELRGAMAALCPDGQRVAVRSSASDEDDASHSFAGQLESFLFVAPQDVLDRVVDVWRSGFSERVFTYRAEHGLSPTPQPPSALVQRMVKADTAGVAFAADPVTGRRGMVVIGAVFGLGTALVSGDADADTYHVDRSHVIRRREIVAKRTADRFVADNAAGIRSIPIAEPNARRPALTDEQIRAVAELTRSASVYLDRPQDVEWAIEDSQLYLLQSRPITSLDHVPDPDGVRLLWDNSNIVESYGGITTPLTFSFARRAYEEVYRQFCKIMGVPRKTIAALDPTLRCMLGLIRGQVYYNLLSWYRLLATLPGFRANQKFMEQMMGVKQGLPESVHVELGAASLGERFRDNLRLCGSVVSLVLNYFTLARRSKKFYDRLNEALAEPSPALAHMRPDELAAYYRGLERQLLTRWDAPIVNDFFAMVFHGGLRKLITAWCNDAGGSLHNNLLCGEGGMIGTELARRLHNMAEEVASDTELVTLLCERSLDEILVAVKQHSPLHKQYQDYLYTFGDRCMEELKLESPTLHDDPLPLLRGIGHLARRLASNDTPLPTEAVGPPLRREAEQRVYEALRYRPLRRVLFNWVLRNARSRVRSRENLRFERTRVFGRVRRIFVELGKRLYAVALLDDAREVFYLEVDEVLGFVDGTTSTTDLKRLASLRKAQFARFAEMDPPDDRFETYGMVQHGNTFRHTHTEAPPEGEERSGMACCPGIVRAKVCVIADPKDAQVRPGVILVADRTDPGWIMLFPSAAGLLVERGSLLSHSAIVARELGIPSIVSISGLMTWLHDGDKVEMDGSTGQVRRLHATAESNHAQ